MSKIFFILFGILAFNSVHAESIEFYFGEEQVRTIQLEELKKGEVKTTELYNPFRKYTKTYQGQDFFSLLDSVYGKKWREANSIRFKAQDGFIQTASVKQMLKASKDHTGILSFSDTQTTGFSEFEKNGKMVNPGPFYLVWTRYESRSIANYNDDLKWPYQLKSIYLLK